MPADGPRSPGSGASTGTGTAWTSPLNITASDDVRATSSLAAGTSTAELWAQFFGFTIPAGDRIDGIVVEVERCQTAGTGGITDLTVQMLKVSVKVGSNYATLALWPAAASESYASYGGPTDLWGTTWTPAEINNANSGVLVQAIEDSGVNAATAAVDHVRMTVYHSTPEPVPNIDQPAAMRASRIAA